MSGVIGFVLVCVVVSTVITYLRDESIVKEKRTYLFETNEGKRYNPFSVDASESTQPTCPQCHSEKEGDFRYCANCSTRYI